MILIDALLIIISFGIIIITIYGIRSLIKSMNSFKAIKWSGNKKVTVIIPARNEEKNIVELLKNLIIVDDKLSKIIIINDRSTDNTEKIVKEYMKIDKRIQLINIKNVNKDWIPKSFALYEGMKYVGFKNAVLFLDADVKGDMQRIIDITSNIKEGQIYAYLPYFECDNFVSKVSQSFLSSILHGYFGYDKTVNKKENYGLMFGCCWSISPYTYYEIGGHASVKNELVEDKNLATRAKQMGVNIIPVDARNFIKTKSWNNSDDIKNLLSRIFYDYEKNLSSTFYVYLLALALILLFYLPLAWIPLLILKRYLLSLLFFSAYFVENVFYYLGGLTNRIKLPFSIFYFIPAYFLVISIINVKYKGVKWKGELYKI
ncbi:MAG: glycosyltransferase [Caldisphaera sp.]|uniref:glycosyltransferase n=1 Tax=Caldisphaera sp. TaxID=2060322 RepID=UPI003D1444ED